MSDIDQDDQTEQFLNTIGQLESSDGQNINHAPMTQGIQAGTTAIGQYGLMPNTVKEMAKRAPSSTMNAVAALPPDQMKQSIELNPELENNIAHQVAQHVLSKQGNDQEKAAYAWHFGHNLSSDQVEQRGYQDNPYVKQFTKIKNSLGNK